MKVRYLKSVWGMPGDEPSEDNLARIRQGGYDGVETALTAGLEAGELRGRLDRHGLDLIGMVFAVTPEDLDAQVRALAPCRPLAITCHGGQDKMTFEEGCAFFRGALAVEEEHGIPIGFETHRNRLLFTPWTTARYLREFPTLKICADFSHFCCVCERMLEDVEGDLATCISRSIHIHGRVGHEEGPQVSDPRAPEWAGHVERHLTWWDLIRKARIASGADSMTFTPEFGPPHYMATLPYTRQPVADLWDVSIWMREVVKERWGA